MAKRKARASRGRAGRTAVVEDIPRTGDVPRTFKTATAAHNHQRLEAMVPMRDGVKLFTLIMVPGGAAGPMPMVLTRTPYSAAKRASRAESPDIAMALPLADEDLVRDGYIRVYQDVRGRFRSKGRYTMTMPLRGPYNAGPVDQVTDTWDTIEWLVANVAGNNGRVGITGVSYDGLLTLMALLEPHPALKAAVPVNPMVDSWMGDDFYHNGALRTVMLEYIYRQTASRDAGHGVPWGYHDLYSAVLEAGSIGELGRRYGADKLPAWRRLLEHPAYDAYWQDQALDRQLARVKCRVPTLMVHSLFDQEDIYGAPAQFAALAARDPGGRRTHLAIGPWCHGQGMGEGSSLGEIRWGADTAGQFRRELLKPFWDRHLKGARLAAPLPRVLAFETGANQWRRYEAWPPVGAVKARRLYLQPGGGLGFEPPAGGQGCTEFISDPARPVPYRVRPVVPSFGGRGSTWSRWLVDDQRPFSDRPDVLSFVSQPLTAPLTIAGPVAATLHAATTGSDADWVVKLIDLYPDEVPSQPELGGYQLMVSGDILRGRYRERPDEARPIPPGQVLPYRVPLPHAHHTFRPGHRVMVQVQSSWFPVYDRNPQTFVDQIAWARPQDFQAAVHGIHHSAAAASFVELPVRREGGRSA
ncbi:MAG: CocE/NonD family hydrolase [Gemmatimonadota bacterium]